MLCLGKSSEALEKEVSTRNQDDHAIMIIKKRRPRYGGTHPRSFQEKYKELDPNRYRSEIQKIVEAGKTPAGSHRPVCLNEILKILAPKPGDLAIDATVGYGGHALEILNRITPGGQLIGFDLDRDELCKTENRIRAAGFLTDSFVSFRANYSHIPQMLSSLKNKKAQLLIADLGLSSMQIDNPARGFSYKVAGPLDMRLDPKGDRSATQLLRSVSERALGKILEKNGDEIFAVEIAKAIMERQRKRPIQTTDALVEAIQSGLNTLPPKMQKLVDDKSTRRCFQALRIAVNEEFRSLDLFLKNIPSILAPGGKVAILTFHSGEDRRVKKAFQGGHRAGIYFDIANEIIRPSPEEIYSNPRAKSAKLRWAKLK